MNDFFYTMVGFVEDLTTDHNRNEETDLRNPDTPFRGPQEVQDLLIFGLMAGKAAEKLDEGDVTPIGEGRANYGDLPALAAVAATRAELWNSLEELIDRTINPIITSLNTPELAEKWSHDEFKYHEFISGIAYVATQGIARDIPMDMVTKALLLSLRHSDNMAEQVSFLMPCLEDKSTDFIAKNEMRFRQEAIETVIRIIECSAGLDETWATHAIQALQSADIESESDLTEENKMIADEVHDVHWEEVNPKTVASFAAWLTAICRYTEFDYEIETLFLDVEDIWEQEDVDDESPDGLAA